MGTIPQSEALAEASPASMSELLARDPFELTRQNRDQIVEYYRSMRAKWAEAEARGEHKRAKKAPQSASIDVPIEDLGL